MWLKTMSAGLMAVLLMAVGNSITALAAPPVSQAQVTLRPLVPTELVTYSVPALQLSAGLNTISIGEPAYLEALVNAAIVPSNIVSVTWTITSQPIGSTATLLPSPLGTNIPTYKMADREDNSGNPFDQVAWPGGVNTGSATNNGRVLLRPDVTGQYTVSATIVLGGGSGTTNLTQTITAGTYLGVETCELCHSGGLIAPDIYHPWVQTPHATFFQNAINGLESSHYSKNCISCHTVGYDSNPVATNYNDGGFYDVAQQLGWTFPATLSPTNWAYMQSAYPALANLGNIQCENCHGPGSQHAYSLGNTNYITKTYIAADCSQCHDDTPNHIKSAEWSNSLHARTTRVPSGAANRMVCVRCHTAPGFQEYADNYGNTNSYATNVVYEAITCQACHDPHNYNNPYQLRLGTNFMNVVLSDGTVVTNAGVGGFCMNCHHIRNGPAASNVANYQQGKPTWAGGSSFGVHDGPQGEMLEGVGAITYGQTLPSSAHRHALTNTCVDCHMQTVASTDPAFLQAGGHTWEMSYNVVTNGVTNTLAKATICAQCHGNNVTTSFDFPVQDYNGDGIIEGVQTEVQHLLDKLSTLLPPSGYQANANNYVADGKVKSPSTQTNMPTKFLNAVYNWQFVANDGSLGIHNAPFAVGLLKASIGDLTGDANNDGLPDAWQISYFGSTTNVLAAPNASPAGDGIPNWLKYSLGLNPMVAGITLPNGVVWVNEDSIGGTTNTIHIYTAAEIAFDTQIGTTYQIQSISNLGGGWSNVGSPMPGTGTTISYLTPTRSGAQQFYRVVHTP
jgi:hypothetical protein